MAHLSIFLLYDGFTTGMGALCNAGNKRCIIGGIGETFVETEVGLQIADCAIRPNYPDFGRFLGLIYRVYCQILRTLLETI